MPFACEVQLTPISNPATHEVGPEPPAETRGQVEPRDAAPVNQPRNAPPPYKLPMRALHQLVAATPVDRAPTGNVGSRRAHRAVGFALAGLVVLAACSDSSSDSPPTSPSTITEGQASTEAPSATSNPAGTEAPGVSDPSSVLDASDPPTILSAYLGAVDLPAILVGRLEDISGCEQQPLDEGMPVVLSHPVDVNTLDPADFAVTTSEGNATTPTCATLEPATEDGELQTILLTGPLGTTDDPPVQVAIIDELLATDGTALTGLEADDLSTFEDGPEMVLARLDPADEPCAALGSTHEIQTTWQGGISGPQNAEPGAAELDGFTLIDATRQPHALLGFDDLGDGDNYLVVCVPPGIEPATLKVQAHTVYDPTNNPNPTTSADVTVPHAAPR